MARAASPRDERPGFRDWVRAWAAEHHGTVEDWWSADLDGDPARENLARVCLSTDPNEMEPGAFLIEDGRGRRFELDYPGFDYTGGGSGCRATSEPPFRTTKDHSLVYAPRVKRSSDQTEYAFRGGELVVLREREGGGRYCQYSDSDEDDWVKLRHVEEHLGKGDFIERGDQCVARSQKRTEAILLVGRPGSAPPTFTQVARGKTRDSTDANMRVAVTQPDEQHLAIRVAIIDDTRIAAAARTAAAIETADHLALWIGKRPLRVARTAQGWFVLPGAGSIARGDASAVELTVPIAWAEESSESRAAPCGASRVTTWRGSLVIAYHDVDEPSAGVHVVVATAPFPTRGEPRGMLLKLPSAARWPSAEATSVPR